LLDNVFAEGIARQFPLLVAAEPYTASLYFVPSGVERIHKDTDLLRVKCTLRAKFFEKPKHQYPHRVRRTAASNIVLEWQFASGT
jgi:hypothetical protein